MNLIKFTVLTLAGLTCSPAQAFAPSMGKKSGRHTALHLASQPIDEGGALQDRRSVLSSIAAIGLAGPGLVTPSSAEAAPAKKPSKKKPRVYFKGAITLKDGAETPPIIGGYKAVFVSARPKNPTNIPPEVVASARGGVPAVFFAILPNPKLPGQKFTLTENDITPEGDFGLSSDPYWWAEETEWEISVRADTDGAVRTFDQTDLVGRTITSQVGEGSPDTEVCIAVAERGFFGSYFQTKNK